MIGEYSGFFNIFSEKKILKNGQVFENQYIYDIFCCIETGCLYMVYILMKGKSYER